MIQEKAPLTFVIVRNDNTKESWKLLIDYKVIIARALPNMGKQHVLRLLFDPKHESLLAYENGQLIGGACYANFEGQSFVELAFFAIKAAKRVMGYGKKIMNQLKCQLQKIKKEYIITFGDNMALGFFRKQGFSQNMTLSPKVYGGYIKQYDGGTLIQCKIHPTLDYNKFEQILRKQKQFVIERIKSVSTNDTKFLGSKAEQLVTQQGFKRNEETFRINPMLLPGVISAQWSWDEHDQLKKMPVESLQVRSKKLIESIKRHPESKFFLFPVSAVEVPTYYSVIQNPMDLHTIQQKISKKQYKNEQQLCQDLNLILDNCQKFNHPKTVYYISGARLRELIKPEVQAFRNYSNPNQ